LDGASIVGNVDFALTTRTSLFENCRSLKSVNLPAATTIEYGAFWSCRSLESVYLPKATSIGVDAFANCISLTNITLKSVITYWGNYVFEDVLPGSVTFHITNTNEYNKAIQQNTYPYDDPCVKEILNY
jgi:hypothetical protein